MAVNAGNHVEITVLASASGQSIINVLNYRAGLTNAAPHTLEDFLTEFRDEWRTGILPLLHESYVIQAYVGRVISSMVFLPPIPPQGPNARPAIRYSEQFILQGAGASDTGDKITDAHPTFTAISAQKVCGPVTDPAGVVLPAEKIIRGGIRLGPIVEADTEALEGNALTAAAAAAALAGLIVIQVVALGGDTMNMEVLSFYKDLNHRVIGPLPTFATATVSSFLVNPFISTQVTRKQRARGGA